MSDDLEKYAHIPKGKDGKPTKAFMEKIFNEDRDLFMKLQNAFFTTGANMNPDRFTKKSKEKMKGDKDVK
jgi:hypothetical protein